MFDVRLEGPTLIIEHSTSRSLLQVIGCVADPRRLPHCGAVTLFERFCLVLADFILVLHAAFIGFVVVGLLLVWVGRIRGWSFVRNFWFRAAHVAAMVIVAAESLLGIVCPLTRWEDQLRQVAGGQNRYAGSFIQHWLHKLIFFNVEERAFTMAYLAFLLAVALSFWLVPPRRPGRPRTRRTR